MIKKNFDLQIEAAFTVHQQSSFSDFSVFWNLKPQLFEIYFTYSQKLKGYLKAVTYF